MDLLTCDLFHHHLARLLHLVPHLHSAFSENCFILPIFFSCVSPAAKKHTRLILLCLQRRFGVLCPPEVFTHILSFLSFPEFVSSPPRPVHRQPSPPLSPSSSGTRKRLREEEEVESISPEQLRIHPPSHDTVMEAEEETEGKMKSLPSPKTVPADEKTTPSSTTAAAGAVEEFTFYVRPPLQGGTLSSTKTTTTHLFVRMISESEHDEETMNRYFGRYGQVSCKLLQRRQMAASHADHPESMITILQDFIVTVDSTENAFNAVRNAYFPELAFIAFHDPVFNVYTLADADRVLQDVPVEVVEGRPAPGGTVTETEGVNNSASILPVQTFVPDVVVDGLPYWFTVDQLRVCFSEYGRVEDVRIAVDDRSGAFTGTALVRMATVKESIALSEGLNGAELKEHPLVSGVLDDRLNILSIRRGTIIQKADKVLPAEFDLSENHRRWV